jgi:hypothetical protein
MAEAEVTLQIQYHVCCDWVEAKFFVWEDWIGSRCVNLQ